MTTYKVHIFKNIVVKETRTSRSWSWNSGARRYKVYDFRPDVRDWIASNLQGKVKCVRPPPTFISRTNSNGVVVSIFIDSNYYASFSRQGDVMLFKLRFSEFIRQEVQ